MRTYEPGTYKVEFTSHQLGQSKEKKTPQLVLAFKPLAMLDGENETHCADEERHLFVYFTENTIDNAVKNLKSIGFTGEDFNLLDPENAAGHSFAGVVTTLRLKYEDYKGNEQERWDFFGGGLKVAPLEKKGIAELNARFGKLFKNGGTPAPAPAKKPAAAAPARDQQTEVF